MDEDRLKTWLTVRACAGDPWTARVDLSWLAARTPVEATIAKALCLHNGFAGCAWPEFRAEAANIVHALEREGFEIQRHKKV